MLNLTNAPYVILDFNAIYKCERLSLQPSTTGLTLTVSAIFTVSSAFQRRRRDLVAFHGPRTRKVALNYVFTSEA